MNSAKASATNLAAAAPALHESRRPTRRHHACLRSSCLLGVVIDDWTTADFLHDREEGATEQEILVWFAADTKFGSLTALLTHLTIKDSTRKTGSTTGTSCCVASVPANHVCPTSLGQDTAFCRWCNTAQSCNSTQSPFRHSESRPCCSRLCAYHAG